MSDSPPKRKMDWSKRAPHHNRPASGIPAKGASIHGSAGTHPSTPHTTETLLANHASKLCQRNEKGRHVPLPKTVENQKLAEEALAKAAEIMREAENPFVVLAASNSIQNRVWGAPKQEIDIAPAESPQEEDAASEIILRRSAAFQSADPEG